MYSSRIMSASACRDGDGRGRADSRNVPGPARRHSAYPGSEPPTGTARSGTSSRRARDGAASPPNGLVKGRRPKLVLRGASSPYRLAGGAQAVHLDGGVPDILRVADVAGYTGMRQLLDCSDILALCRAGKPTRRPMAWMCPSTPLSLPGRERTASHRILRVAQGPDAFAGPMHLPTSPCRLILAGSHIRLAGLSRRIGPTALVALESGS